MDPKEIREARSQVRARERAVWDNVAAVGRQSREAELGAKLGEKPEEKQRQAPKLKA